MKVVLSRSYGLKQTTSSFYVFDGDRAIFNCKSFELPELGNKKKVSCIPEGVYKVFKIYSPTKGKCFELHDVQGRSNILIHVGNYASGNKVDTEGCILVGLRFVDINEDGNIDVADSVKAMAILLSILPDSFKIHII
jgi:hypothetical protein